MGKSTSSGIYLLGRLPRNTNLLVHILGLRGCVLAWIAMHNHRQTGTQYLTKKAAANLRNGSVRVGEKADQTHEVAHVGSLCHCKLPHHGGVTCHGECIDVYICLRWTSKAPPRALRKVSKHNHGLIAPYTLFFTPPTCCDGSCCHCNFL